MHQRKTSNSQRRFVRGLPALTLTAVIAALPLSAHPDIYKWVDAKGQTHYSDDKGDARGAKTSEVMVPSAPAAPVMPAPSTEYLRTPTPPQASATAKPPPSAQSKDRTPPAFSDGRDHGTDASRCALARDVLSGAVVHRNGKPTDTYDKQVAQNDVKAFCKGR
jgi:hypothetical protein